MSRTLSFSGIALGTAALIVGYALGSSWIGAGLVAAAGLLWALGQWRGPRWTSSAGLAVMVVAAAWGAALDLAMGWMLAGTGAALCAWELDSWSQRLAAGRVLQQAEMERRHLTRLLVVVGLGLGLAALTTLVRLQPGFLWLLILAIVAAIALARAIGRLRESY